MKQAGVARETPEMNGIQQRAVSSGVRRHEGGVGLAASGVSSALSAAILQQPHSTGQGAAATTRGARSSDTLTPANSIGSPDTGSTRPDRDRYLELWPLNMLMGMTLLDAGLPQKVAEKLDEIYISGLVSHSDLDERAIEALKEFNEEGALAVLQQFKDSDLSHVQVHF
ncbi:unnamed protein product [Ranitomeya imitator]|uniref:Heterogeneous nuclear ribonucleoprotein Q acidic domain-containing protein n=1 Tax=Ranitomeya imitator TaxID=111125 RepID=A0ABN9M334_9NEOB|nr:unnamed protein product [Ranitomeya imitator]